VTNYDILITKEMCLLIREEGLRWTIQLNIQYCYRPALIRDEISMQK